MSEMSAPAMGLSVSVLGLGLMGRPIFRTLAAAGVGVTAWKHD